MKGKPYNRLASAEAQKIKRFYVCAQCWGELTVRLQSGRRMQDRYMVLCEDCGEDRGFVTREYADQRRNESNAEAVEAGRNLGELLGIEAPDKNISFEQAIQALWPE